LRVFPFRRFLFSKSYLWGPIDPQTANGIWREGGSQKVEEPRSQRCVSVHANIGGQGINCDLWGRRRNRFPQYYAQSNQRSLLSTTSLPTLLFSKRRRDNTVIIERGRGLREFSHSRQISESSPNRPGEIMGDPAFYVPGSVAHTHSVSEEGNARLNLWASEAHGPFVSHNPCSTAEVIDPSIIRRAPS